MKAFFDKFEGRRKPQKELILIVDDDPKYLEKYSDMARELGYEVITADCVKEGIAKAVSGMPYAIVTDKDMPDGTGSDLAEAVKKEYEVRIGGITGGNPQDFRDAVDIKESKSISRADYRSLVKALMESEKPAEEYAKSVKRPYKIINGELMQHLVALDIIVQGYVMGSQLNRGEEPFPGAKEMVGRQLQVPSEEQLQSLMDLNKIGLDTDTLYDNLRDLIQGVDGEPRKYLIKFIENPEVKLFFEKLENKSYEGLEEASNKYHDAYCQLVEGLKCYKIV